MEKFKKHANGQWELEKASLLNDRKDLDKADEKEPHKDDPKHEEKEQKKAKEIKGKAEEILDMHKDEKRSKHGEVVSTGSAEPAHPAMKGETCHVAKNGQWSLSGVED